MLFVISNSSIRRLNYIMGAVEFLFKHFAVWPIQIALSHQYI